MFIFFSAAEASVTGEREKEIQPKENSPEIDQTSIEVYSSSTSALQNHEDSINPCENVNKFDNCNQSETRNDVCVLEISNAGNITSSASKEPSTSGLFQKKKLGIYFDSTNLGYFNNERNMYPIIENSTVVSNLTASDQQIEPVQVFQKMTESKMVGTYIDSSNQRQPDKLRVGISGSFINPDNQRQNDVKPRVGIAGNFINPDHQRQNDVKPRVGRLRLIKHIDPQRLMSANQIIALPTNQMMMSSSTNQTLVKTTDSIFSINNGTLVKSASQFQTVTNTNPFPLVSSQPNPNVGLHFPIIRQPNTNSGLSFSIVRPLCDISTPSSIAKQFHTNETLSLFSQNSMMTSHVQATSSSIPTIVFGQPQNQHISGAINHLPRYVADVTSKTSPKTST